MTFLRCLRLVYLQSLREHLFSKKTVVFVIGSLIYAGIIGLVLNRVGDRENHNEVFAGITLGVYLQALIPLTTIFFSISAIRDEISNRTLVFLISGPVPRSSVWLAKFLAASSVALIVLGIGLGAAAAAAQSAPADWGRGITPSMLEAPVLPLLLGVPAYAAVGCLCALWFKRPMIAGALFVIGWEELVGSTPGKAGVRSMTVVDSMRTMFYHSAEAAPQYQRAQRFWRGAGEDTTMPTMTDGVHAILWLTAIALLLALWIGSSRDYDAAPKD